MFKNRIKRENKIKHLSNQKSNVREIDKILSEYANKKKKIFRNIKTKSYNTLGLNKTYNEKEHIFGKKLSKKKKLEEELYTISKENRNIFRNALNKYNFDLEVYVPQNLTNKEYSNKNYLINKLIYIEKMNKDIKEKIRPIEKETKLFSKQYKLIKADNKDHQKTYINNVEQLYQKNGYKIENIEYKDNENIFTPSFLLDKKFGKDQNKDVSKYSKQDFDFNLDKMVLQKLNIASNKYGENSNNENNENNINQFKKLNSNVNWISNEKDEEMKKEILEEQKIMNMSKREYRAYNRKLKKDINAIKKRIYELNNTNTNFNNTQSEGGLNTIRTNYTGSNLKMNFGFKDKIDNNQNVEPKKISKRKDEGNNIFLSARGLDLETDFNQFLPSINSIVENKKEKDKDKEQKNKNKTVPNILKNKKIKYFKGNNLKQNKTKKLYSLLNNRKGNYEFPYQEIESYLKKHTKRQLPRINPSVGSNIHGILDDFQNQVKDNSFSSIAKGNEFIRIDMDNNYVSDNNKSLENKVEKMDEKIENLHFTVLDKLLSLNKKELFNN